MPFEYGDLVDSDLGHALERAVCQAIVDNHFDRPEDSSPACLEDGRDLVPGQASGPSGQKDLVGVSHLLFPVHPGNPFSLNSIPGTVDPAREEAEDHPVVPQGKILDLPGTSAGIVDRSFPAAHRTFGTASFSGSDLNRENWSSRMRFLDPYAAKNEALEILHPVE